MNPVLSVFLMTYNEAETLSDAAREIHDELIKLDRSFEFVIIDDGSRDGSSEKADSIASSLAATRVIHHGENLGLGGVYRTGFAEAKGDLITFFPADGQFPAKIIARFLDLISDCDMVLGYIPDRRSSVLAKLLSFSEKALYAALFGPLPKFQGVMVFRSSLLKEFRLKSSGRGWAVLMELIIRTQRAHRRIKSVPTEMRPRNSGISKVNNIPTITANLKQVIALRGLLR